MASEFTFLRKKFGIKKIFVYLHPIEQIIIDNIKKINDYETDKQTGNYAYPADGGSDKCCGTESF